LYVSKYIKQHQTCDAFIVIMKRMMMILKRKNFEINFQVCMSWIYQLIRNLLLKQMLNL